MCARNWAALLVVVFLFSCNRKPSKPSHRALDTPVKGTIYISVDETFRPVIEEEIKMFQATYPGTSIIAHYKPEAECLQDLLQDSIRMAIVTRGLKEEERAYIRDSTGYPTAIDKLAFDAISVVVNRNNPRNQFTMEELKQLLLGKDPDGLYPVLDAKKATSTIRYALDSILRGAKPGSTLYAAQNSTGVLDFVSNNVNAVGFVGISWIGNHEDSTQLRYLEKVKITRLRCDTCKEDPFIFPDQKSIYNGTYPLIRPLVYILKENFNGLGKGFTGYMTLENGQLIFRRAYLYPAHMNFLIRKTTL